MLSFRAADPFPLVDLSAYRQQELFTHAAACDRWLGFNIAAQEKKLAAHGCLARARARTRTDHREAQQIWIGLDPQMLLTPYTEIRSMLEQLRPAPGARVVDLGAAYGRMGLVLARHFPQTEFVGYEYVGERVREANRVLQSFGATRARVEHVDLSDSDFAPARADIYFLYDYGHLKAIEKTLYDLRRLALDSTTPITLVVRGRHCRYLIDRRHKHEWLNPTFEGDRSTIYTTISSSARSQAFELDTDSRRA